MQLSELIDRYDNLSKEIVEAINNGDDGLLVSSDRALSKCIEDLLDYNPTNSNEAAQLVDFFLGCISPSEMHSPTNQEMKQRIVSLISSPVI